MANPFTARRQWAAAVIAFFFSPFVAMLYLNRGKLALVYLAAGFVNAALAIWLAPAAFANQLAPVSYLLELPVTIAGTIHAWNIARRWDAGAARAWYSHWYAAFAIWLIFPLSAFLIRTFLYQPFSIPSVSNEPALVPGDYIFVSKSAYNSRAPERGDMVVFKMPNPASSDFGKDYVKRIVGLPGDRVQMVNGQLAINGTMVPRRRIADYVEVVDGTAQHVLQYEESLPGGRKDTILDRMTDGPLDNTGIYVVPPGHYFTLGDNRDNSDDSREDVGYVPRDAIIGRVAVKFVSGGHLVWQAVN